MANINLKHAPEVERVAKQLIQKYHRHLIEAKIVYLFRHGNWTSKRKTKYGHAEKANPKIKYLTDGTDFIITISYDAWQHLPQSARDALVDHQLCHCARGDDDKHGNPTWYIDHHTVEDFAAVIRRHGLWAEDLKMIMRALEDNKTQQTELFSPNSDYIFEQSSKATCGRPEFDEQDCPEGCSQYLSCKEEWLNENKEGADDEQQENMVNPTTKGDEFEDETEPAADPAVVSETVQEQAESAPLF